MHQIKTVEQHTTTTDGSDWTAGVAEAKRALRQHEDAYWVIGRIAAELIPVTQGEKDKAIRAQVEKLSDDVGMLPDTLNAWRLTCSYFGGPVQPEDLPAGNPSMFPWKVYKDVKNHFGVGGEEKAITFLRTLERRNSGHRWKHADVMKQLPPNRKRSSAAPVAEPNREMTHTLILRHLDAMQERIGQLEMPNAIREQAETKLNMILTGLNELRKILESVAPAHDCGSAPESA